MDQEKELRVEDFPFILILGDNTEENKKQSDLLCKRFGIEPFSWNHNGSRGDSDDQKNVINRLEEALKSNQFERGILLNDFPLDLKDFNELEGLINRLDLTLSFILHLDALEGEKEGQKNDLVDHLKRNHSNTFASIGSKTEEEIHSLILKTLGRIIDNKLGSFDRLKRRILLGETIDAEYLIGFRNQALLENVSRKTGTVLRRFVYLKTENVLKWKEHAQSFESLYGIEVLRIPNQVDDKITQMLLNTRSKGLIPLAVIREESNLCKLGSNSLSTMRDGVTAVDRCKMTAWTLDPKEGMKVNQYSCQVVGKIDLSRRKRRGQNVGNLPSQAEKSTVIPQPIETSVFGWDDIFVPNECGFSYHQLARFGIKNSARKSVISDFLKDTVYYKTAKQFIFSSLESSSRVVDFKVNVADLIESNPYYNNEIAVRYGYSQLIQNAINMGMFWRRAENRRQNTYWCPGLNGGLPVVPKKDDPIHEDTYRAHDLGHYVIPDLIYTGNSTIHHRRAYIAYRMISEATTMALADMLFVHSLKSSGVEYDYDKRRIYPLFRDLGISFDDKKEFMKNLKRVVRANFFYCLKGDDSEYIKLLEENGVKDRTTLERFKEKYMPFFVEDFRWTEKNFDNMVSRSEELEIWWEKIEPLRTLPGIRVESIDDFLDCLSQSNSHFKDLGEDEFINLVFDVVFHRNVEQTLTVTFESVSENEMRFRAFTRWIMGQLAIFSRFQHLYDASQEENWIIQTLSNYSKSPSSFSLQNIEEIRTRYESYLSNLVKRNLISKDDERTFKEVYPLFDPFYVSYDNDSDQYENLMQVSKRVFSLSNHIQKHLDLAQKHIQLDGSSSKSIKNMIDMIEKGNGGVIDGIFVKRPGVYLLKGIDRSQSNVDQAEVTFLLSGITLDTSLELSLEKGAKVVRLTNNSKETNAPLFRVQGKSTINQRVQISGALETNRLATPETEEIKNMMQPGCKVTAVHLSMVLSDYRLMITNRKNSHSNNSELDEVLSVISKQLDPLFAGQP
eukprot:TRINITY_DN4128_c0_g3_i1.p1 TRINITY_DN4128_c0_g3~~TRINITY_DN4128_c0_g3_i1.p1  ORF type:complete len:1013 (+),score=345.52 TRINITY_DN4128_c0_g3_i1:212-3250(+)